MSPRRSLLCAVSLLLGCGGSTQATQHDAGPDHAADTGPRADASDASDGGAESAGPPDNVVPLVVNAGPPSVGGGILDTPYVSVTVCVPGTSECQTIDYVTPDTGSTGLRVLSSALSMTLPAQASPSGGTLAECVGYIGGYTWGSIRLADVKIAGRVAARVPIQVIGDLPTSEAPALCSEAGPAEDDAASLGSFGLMGINAQLADCGDSCANPVYFSCLGTTCSEATVPVADQVKNPLALLDSDNNGVVVELPTLPAGGEKSATGSLILGIGTASNNALGKAKVLTLAQDDFFTTIYKGQTIAMSFLDTGSSALAFNDSALTQCSLSSDGAGFYCPSSTVTLMAVHEGQNGISQSVSFTVGNANTLFGEPGFTAFDDLAVGAPGAVVFDWGLPFFFGRRIFFAFDGAETTGGKGPYVAY